MACIPSVRPSVEKEKHILTIKNGTKPIKEFLLTIHKSADTHILYLGGEHTYCIEIQVYLPGSIYERFTNIEDCILANLYYNKLCSLSGGFQRGVDTTLILQTMVSFIRNTYPFVKRLQLKDYSTRKCDESLSINLYEFYYIQYDKTWYQRTYGAYRGESDERVFSEANTIFQEKKKEISWDIFIQFFKDAPYDLDKAEHLYLNTDSWQAFFIEWRILFPDIASFCIFLQPWLSGFLKALMKYDFTAPYYYIDLANMPDIQYLIKIRGGGKRIKKQTRNKRLFAIQNGDL